MIKRRSVKICVCLLAVILSGGFYSHASRKSLPIALEVSAVSEPYKMTDIYKSSVFYQNLCSLELSGDEGRDVLAIAMSQVGYHEGNSDADMHGESITGTRDFVEYNVLAGMRDNNQDNGMSYGYYWCASFVNWCLRMAGVSEAASGSEISCQRWYNDCKELGIFSSKLGYIPSSGDIIFFRDVENVASTHVGLVRYCDGAYVYTVEGNTSNGNEYSSNGEYVALKKHDINSKYIVGYASPKYECNNSFKAVDHSGGYLSCGQYISDRKLDVFSDKELTRKTGAKIPAFTLFYVTEISNNVLKIDLGGKSGYISSSSGAVQLTTSENVYMIEYKDENGTPLFMPQYRCAGEKKNVYSNRLEKENCGFVGWSIDTVGDTVLFPGDELPDLSQDIVLAPVYDEALHTISFYLQDGTLLSQETGYYGEEYAIPTPAVPDGQIFTGWDTEPDGVIRGDTVYTALFVPVGEISSETESEGEVPASRGCASSFSGTVLLFPAISLCLSAFLVVKRKK